ncbi:MAG: hypothetical protein IPH05_07785 [Flavobacteriales bacterium]|nr:hypothetical protein [Flavobacteriales bacterium]MBK7620073.1 hypothetical protein [Flavobacteriales bacterium]MBK9627479.1 hypothetical protein [Flavobacteriales bacterium]MBP9176525.1 hypothetical protein [Flavobacteriales bacterium]
MKDRFPTYRRLSGADHLYRIDALDRFVELQRIGSRWVRHEVHALAYPEKVRIMEMIEGADGRFLPIAISEWDAAHAQLSDQANL